MTRRLLFVLILLAVLVSGVLVYLFTFNGDMQIALINEDSGHQESFRGSVDSVSAASLVHYFPDSRLTGTQLQRAFGSSIPSLSIATVNEDGSPNIAMLSPIPVSNDYIMIILSDTQTRRNLERYGMAAAAAYSYTPMAAPDAQYQGSRLVLELEKDPQVIQKLQQQSDSENPDAVFLRIIRILPLG